MVKEISPCHWHIFFLRRGSCTWTTDDTRTHRRAPAQAPSGSGPKTNLSSWSIVGFVPTLSHFYSLLPPFLSPCFTARYTVDTRTSLPNASRRAILLVYKRLPTIANATEINRELTILPCLYPFLLWSMCLVYCSSQFSYIAWSL